MATASHSPGLLCSNIASDRQCLDKSGPILMSTGLYNFNWLFDPQSTPTIYIGPLAIAGPLLTLIVSVVFVYHKLLRTRNRRHDLEIKIDIARLPPTPYQNNLQWPGLRHHDAPRIYTARASLLFHGVITNGAIMHFGRSFLENDTLCRGEAVALLLYAEIVKPKVRRSCLAAALGWTLFMYLDRLPDTIAVIATWLVTVLAAPLPWQINGSRGEMEYQQSSSGLLLMSMAANRVVFNSQVATQQWVEDFPVEALKALAALHVVNGMVIHVFDRNRDVRLQATHWSAQEMLDAFKHWMNLASRICILVAAFFGAFVGGIVCTAHLSSCLPWSRLLFGKCASSLSPSLYALMTGCSVYPGMFLILAFTRRRNDQSGTNRTVSVVSWRQLEVSANTLDWACLFLNSLYVALVVLI